MSTRTASGDAVEAAATWEGLPEPWKVAFEQAWRSWRAGSGGVGAAVTDAAGDVVARGRNAMFDHEPDASVLAETYMAHAEMSALVLLPVGEYEDYDLFTTFEPCPMCACTIRMYRIGRVHYASSDPVWDGLHDVFAGLPALARRLPERVRLGGPLGVFGHALHVNALGERAPQWVVEAHETLAPGELRLARRLSATGRIHALARAGSHVNEVLSELWPELCAVTA